MAWILDLILITSMSTTAYRMGQYGSPTYYHGYPNDYDYPEYTWPVRRVDNRNYYQPQFRMNERPTHAIDERPNQRMNERSIAVTSRIQQVQEQERKRLQTKIDGSRRIENGTYKIVNDYPKLYTNISNKRDQLKVSTDSVVFPGLTSRTSELQPEISAECQRLGYCEEVPNYPKERVAEILSKLTDSLIESLKIDDVETPEIAQRIGPIEEVELCDVESRIIYPKSLPDEHGKWHFIINPDGDPLQGIHVEICKESKKPCNKLASFYTGYESMCKQKYFSRYLAGVPNSVDELGVVPLRKTFKIPSCCSCVVRQVE